MFAFERERTIASTVRLLILLSAAVGDFISHAREVERTVPEAVSVCATNSTTTNSNQENGISHPLFVVFVDFGKFCPYFVKAKILKQLFCFICFSKAMIYDIDKADASQNRAAAPPYVEKIIS